MHTADSCRPFATQTQGHFPSGLAGFPREALARGVFFLWRRAARLRHCPLLSDPGAPLTLPAPRGGLACLDLIHHEKPSMRIPFLRHVALALFAALLLGACHGKDAASQPGGSSPVAAVQASIDLVKAGDFNGLWKHALPPADYANLRADWSRPVAAHA